MELTRDEARRIAVISDFGMHSVVNSALSGQEGPRAMTMRKVIVLGCVLVAIAITLKVKLTTPQGPQPLALALFTTHLQQLRGDLALP
jgi:hypothetical protein